MAHKSCKVKAYWHEYGEFVKRIVLSGKQELSPKVV